MKISKQTTILRDALPALALVFLLGSMAGACGMDEEISQRSQALTADQCSFFAVDGNVTICHKTASTQHPYTSIKKNESNCGGHTDHDDDYVSVGDPSCNGSGCFPIGAPYDGTVECCEGLVAEDGICVDAAPVLASCTGCYSGEGECFWINPGGLKRCDSYDEVLGQCPMFGSRNGWVQMELCVAD